MLRARTETQKTQVVQRSIAARETERRLEADLEVAQEQAKLAAERSQDERSQVQDLQAQQVRGAGRTEGNAEPYRQAAAAGETQQLVVRLALTLGVAASRVAGARGRGVAGSLSG